MGLFGGSSSKSTSTTKNYENTLSQTSGDLSYGNIISGGTSIGDRAVVNGFFGEDLQVFLKNVGDNFNTALGYNENLAKMAAESAQAAAESNSNLAGKSIQSIANSYQSAYSGTAGIIQQIKPVLLVGVGVFALLAAQKYLR